MIWKLIPNFPNYEISENGLIRRNKKLLHPHINMQTGYLMVDLYKNNKRKKFTIHRLVAITFLRKKNRKYVCHSDGLRRNNHYTNLYWGSPKDNIRDRRAHGRGNEGERNPCNKLTIQDVHEIKLHYGGCLTQKEIASLFNICRQTVSDIWRGKRWPHVII